MDWIGVTGLMGAGKTTASQMIESLGHPVAYADEIAKSVLEPGAEGLTEVAVEFGQEVLSENGTLDRARLAEKVFGNPEQLLSLEKITHPKIQAEVLAFQQRCRELNLPLAFYDVPLLFEKSLQSRFDTIVCVVASQETLFARLRKRETWSDEEIQNRLDHQLSEEVKVEGSQYILQNDGSVEALKLQIENMVSDLLTNPKKNPHRA